ALSMPEKRMSLEAIVEHLGNKTVSLLYAEASAEETGIAFDAVKAPNGKRAYMVLCVTEPNAIRGIEKVFDFGNDSPPAPWDQLLVSEFLMRCGPTEGLAYEDIQNF
ncbi:MAG: hypothetical protein QNL33_09670, partial [Akkermansiaceae bacterium]